MSLDNDRILPDQRTRHWMIAQSHIHFRDGKEEEIARERRVRMAADPAAGIAEYQMATDVDKARAKKAYDSIRTMISKKDLNSDNLFEDLIAEKALEFDQVS